ncbi:hypothetical protein K438DRAFT_1781688 [Mycena galopus ATCC 62051]|nr:hypothetical protein K438DRAFT_1781688 [Mycena galopus ATCC 62051]
MLALSNLAALLVSFSLAITATPGAQPTPDVGAVFAVYPGWDMDDGSIGTILGGTELACMQSCSTSATCIAYAYVPYGGANTGPGPACVPKSSINLTTFKTQSFDLSVGLLGGCGTFGVLTYFLSFAALAQFYADNFGEAYRRELAQKPHEPHAEAKAEGREKLSWWKGTEEPI